MGWIRFVEVSVELLLGHPARDDGPDLPFSLAWCFENDHEVNNRTWLTKILRFMEHEGVRGSEHDTVTGKARMRWKMENPYGFTVEKKNKKS